MLVDLNMDRDKSVYLHFDDIQWSPSPAAGVERKMLEREQAETGQATSIVRYAPGTAFPEHIHGGGEEFLVLSGTFSDENGDYPTLSYVRNPVNSRHSPFSTDGCIIFVKLWQMHPEQKGTIQNIDLKQEYCMLYKDDFEEVSYRYYSESCSIDLAGTETIIIEGNLTAGDNKYSPWSWLRTAKNDSTIVEVAKNTRIYQKKRLQ